MRTSLRRVAGCILLVLLHSAFAVAPLAATARAGRTPTIVLAGENHIHLDGPARFEVRLPRQATLSFHSRSQLEIDGAGRFVGLLFRRATAGWRNLPFLLAGLYRTCAGAGCEGPPRRFVQPAHLKKWDKIRLPAGRYVLYAVNDGAPADIVLRLRGFPGTVELEPAAPARVTVGRPTVQVSSSPLPNLLWAGQTDTVTTDAFSWTALWQTGDAGLVSNLGTCVYRGRPPGDDRLAYRSGCSDDGARESGSSKIVLTTGFLQVLRTIDHFAPGTWSHGVYVESASLGTEVGALNLLLEL